MSNFPRTALVIGGSRGIGRVDAVIHNAGVMPVVQIANLSPTGPHRIDLGDLLVPRDNAADGQQAVAHAA